MSSFVNATLLIKFRLPEKLYVAYLLPLSIHSHIQGPVFADGEASLRLIHLHGGAAGIQQDSINAAWLNVHVRQQGFKLAESAKQWFHTTTEQRMRESNSAIRHLYMKAYGTTAVKSIFKSTAKFHCHPAPNETNNKKRIREKYITFMCGSAI